jgi:hypothetical protein
MLDLLQHPIGVGSAQHVVVSIGYDPETILICVGTEFRRTGRIEFEHFD